MTTHVSPRDNHTKCPWKSHTLSFFCMRGDDYTLEGRLEVCVCHSRVRKTILLWAFRILGTFAKGGGRSHRDLIFFQLSNCILPALLGHLLFLQKGSTSSCANPMGGPMAYAHLQGCSSPQSVMTVTLPSALWGAFTVDTQIPCQFVVLLSLLLKALVCLFVLM